MLPPVSQGYPADRGGLHTRYAPVRHSHPPEGGLPYDLHVLGLPLAFILSQDQTLRCTIDFLVFFSVVSGPPSLLFSWFLIRMAHASRRNPAPRYCAGLKLSKNFRKPLAASNALFPLFAGCKDTTLFRIGKHFFQKFFILYLISLIVRKKIFMENKKKASHYPLIMRKKASFRSFYHAKLPRCSAVLRPNRDEIQS